MKTTERCNARKSGNGDLEPADPGPWAGDGYCKREAGWGTDHTGQGRCRQHGGATPIKTGRYSKVERDRIQELVQQQQEHGGDPLDVEEELHMARALLTDFINRQKKLQEALIRWYEESDRDRPGQVPSLQDAVGMIDRISKMVKRVQDARSKNAISRPDLFRVITEMMRSVEMRVDDEDTVEAIREDWLEIRVP